MADDGAAHKMRMLQAWHSIRNADISLRNQHHLRALQALHVEACVDAGAPASLRLPRCTEEQTSLRKLRTTEFSVHIYEPEMSMLPSLVLKGCKSSKACLSMLSLPQRIDVEYLLHSQSALLCHWCLSGGAACSSASAAAWHLHAAAMHR